MEATQLAAPVPGTQQPDPTFTINGGANAALFEVSADGLLSFSAGSEPPYQPLAEGSTDNSANVYEVIVEVSAGDQTSTETITVTVEDSTAPMIVGIHDQGISESAAQLSLVEGNKEVLQLSAFDSAGGAVTGYWSIMENVDDGDLFTIDDANNLVFKATPSFVDGGNNVYQLTVSVSDNADPSAVGANTRDVQIEVAIYETPDYIFNPNPDFNGTVELNYVVSDGNGGNQLATNTLTISPLNDAPERVAGNVSTLFLVEDAPLTSMGLEDVEYGVGGGSDEESSQSLTYTVSSVPADTVGRIYSADVGTTTSDAGVLSGQMKGDGTTGFGVSTISMVDSSGEYHNLTAHGIDGLTINDDGTYTFDAQDGFYNGVTTAAGVVSGELIGAGTAGYAFASATTRDGLAGDFQDVVGDVAGLTINPDGSFSFDTQNAAYSDLAVDDTRQINVSYEFTSGGATETE
ncbi:MAG: cadherin-like domain-containing protein, partial [Pseudomonadota bacterium]|nr:cadherin-like domain-containing protein [Pseudomonadota bacterium]